MTFDFFGRLQKELFISGSTLYEMVLAISEHVNRKVQIIKLHWHATELLQRIEEVTAQAGRQLVDQVAHRFLLRDSDRNADMVLALDASLARAVTEVQGLKQALVKVDTKIRDLKLEAIHENMLTLQHDLMLRSARLERLAITRHAPAAGRSFHEMPRSSSVHIVVVIRGPFLLAPSDSLVFQPDDIVVLIGLESELDQAVRWFAEQRSIKAQIGTSG